MASATPFPVGEFSRLADAWQREDLLTYGGELIGR